MLLSLPVRVQALFIVDKMIWSIFFHCIATFNHYVF